MIAPEARFELPRVAREFACMDGSTASWPPRSHPFPAFPATIRTAGCVKSLVRTGSASCAGAHATSAAGSGGARVRPSRVRTDSLIMIDRHIELPGPVEGSRRAMSSLLDAVTPRRERAHSRELACCARGLHGNVTMPSSRPILTRGVGQ